MELFLLVLRNLLARPVRSLLTLLGVLVATASMVLFLSFGEGLRRALFQELSRVGPAIQVVPEGAEGFVFGALPEIPPETLKALEEQEPLVKETQAALAVEILLKAVLTGDSTVAEAAVVKVRARPKPRANLRFRLGHERVGHEQFFRIESHG